MRPKPGSFPVRLVAVLRRLAPLIRRHRGLLLKGTLGTLLVVACRLAFPWPLRGMLELAFDEPGDSTVVGLVPSWGEPELWLGGAFVAIVLTQGLAELIQRLSFARFAIGLVHDARTEALDRITRSRKASAPGDLIARVVGDSARFKSGLKGVLIRLTQNGTFFLGVAAMLLIIDLRLGAIFALGGTAILAVAAVGASRVARISRRLRKKEGRLANHMHAVMSGQGARDADLERSEQDAGRAEAKTTRMEGMTIWCVHALLAATTCSVLLVGLQGVRSGRLAAAELFTVLFYLILVHNPTVRLGRQAVRVGRVLASAERLIKVMDRPEESEPDAAGESVRDPRHAAAAAIHARGEEATVAVLGAYAEQIAALSRRVQDLEAEARGPADDLPVRPTGRLPRRPDHRRDHLPS